LFSIKVFMGGLGLGCSRWQKMPKSPEMPKIEGQGKSTKTDSRGTGMNHQMGIQRERDIQRKPEQAFR
jgi:hypothetical protein